MPRNRAASPRCSRQRRAYVQLYNDKKHTVAQICVLMGISRPTLYKYIESARLVNKCT
ncbi:helix-turn-helix domain-containing protein [Providencia rettgeri]|uniref:helix-turn-helix domain-containing protein n=1 Tax=Providencia rettgeri TaxID=587 RepID=UPI0020B2C98C|nr:helix-turn-helix domain-containing protein [Providencia rettgeri]